MRPMPTGTMYRLTVLTACCYHIYGMKTTIDLPGPLLREAKELAARRGISLRAVFMLGLERALRDDRNVDRPFRLQTVVTHGEGSQIEGDWPEMRARAYEGRGG